MTKRERLHLWLLNHGFWVYLCDVPYAELEMSHAGCSSALRDLVASGRADSRVVGLTQYKAKPGATPKRGPKPPKG